jgi:hypothetical protein
MWHEGIIGIGRVAVKYWVKAYKIRSQFGIEGGKISKLILERKGTTIANYDRGWDIKPQGYEAEVALAILMKEYN